MSEPPVDFDKLWNYPDPAGSEQRLAALLPAAEAAGDADYLAQLLTQIARAQGLQRRYDDAAATLDRAEKRITPEMTVATIRLLLERGRVHNDSLRKAEAKACFEKAWEIGLAHWGEPKVDFFALDAAHMIAIVEPPESAVRWNLLALDQAAKSQDERARGWSKTLRNNLAWAYSWSGQFEKAAAMFEQLAIDYAAAGRAQWAREARWSHARNLRLLGRVDQAFAIQQEIAAALPADDPNGYGHEEIAECLLTLGRPDQAKPHFAKAWDVLSKDPRFPPTDRERLTRMHRLGYGQP